MSCWARVKCKIRVRNDASRALLKGALEVLAKKLNSELKENFLVRGFSRQQRCQFAIPLNLAYGNAIGINVLSDGRIELVGDFHGFNIRRIERELEKIYMALAVIQSAQQLGWTVNVNEVKEGVVIDMVMRR